MWVWAKAHPGQKCSTTPAGLCKPQEEPRESAVPRQLTTTSHSWLQGIAHNHCVCAAFHYFPPCIWSPDAVGQGDFRGFLPQQKTEVWSTDLCDCWKCESSFSRISFISFMCPCFTENVQKAQREATNRKGLYDFLILSTPSGICRLGDLGHSTQCHPALSLS